MDWDVGDGKGHRGLARPDMGHDFAFSAVVCVGGCFAASLWDHAGQMADGPERAESRWFADESCGIDAARVAGLLHRHWHGLGLAGLDLPIDGLGGSKAVGDADLGSRRWTPRGRRALARSAGGGICLPVACGFADADGGGVAVCHRARWKNVSIDQGNL